MPKTQKITCSFLQVVKIYMQFFAGCKNLHAVFCRLPAIFCHIWSHIWRHICHILPYIPPLGGMANMAYGMAWYGMVRGRGDALKILRVKINERGERVGDSHPLAKLSDAEVELMRRLNEEGMTYTDLAEKFDVPVRTVKAICRFERRNQVVAAVKVVRCSG